MASKLKKNEKVYKISLEELVCLETILNTQSTYYIIDLKFSKLFNEILAQGKKGIIPILETRILLHTLINIPFLNENKGTQILKDLSNCIENNWYSKEDNWNCKSILNELKKLQKLILFDYLIYGSLVIYSDGYIKWELKTALVLDINKDGKKKIKRL